MLNGLKTFIAIVLMTTVVSALPLSYTNITIAHLNAETEGIDTSGYSIGLNCPISKKVFVLLTYISLDADDDDVNTDTLEIGIGFHNAMSRTTDLIATFAYFDSQYDASLNNLSFSDNGTGYKSTLGFRQKISTDIEFNAEFIYVSTDFKIIKSDATGYNIGARLFTSNTSSIGVQLESLEDNDILIINMRFDF